MQGFGLEEDRPDKSLILADTMNQIQGAIECRQLAPDVINTPEGLATVTRVAREMNRCAMVPKFYEKTWDRIVGRAP